MSGPKELKRGDACPSCDGELRPARVLSDEEFRLVYDRENPMAVPPHTDTANARQRAELGELHICALCGYKTRFPAETAAREPDRPTADRPAWSSPSRPAHEVEADASGEAARLRARIAELEARRPGGPSGAA